MEIQTNWAGNYAFGAARYHFPTTVEQIQELVGSCMRIKALGSRHSFNGIADCTEDLVSLAHFDKIVSLDRARRTVTVEAGMTYGQIARYLHSAGYAVHNLASLPHITVAGACATATHGSGDGNGNLATAVCAMEIVTADGERVELTRDRDGDVFRGAVVNLGGLGIVTKLTLDIGPTFAVRQHVYENLPLTELEEHFDTILSSAYSVSLFTDWRGATINQVWRKRRVTDADPFEGAPAVFSATSAVVPRHPLDGLPTENCTEQGGVPGPWHERLPHFRMDFMASAGEELQSEYLLPRRHASAALRALYDLREQVAPLLQISEIRTVAADDLWMSTCYRENCIALHFTWIKDWPAVKALLPQIEAALMPFDARPHWGKLFTMSAAQLQPLYPKLQAFRELLRSYDPQGKFRNAFLDATVFGAD